MLSIFSSSLYNLGKSFVLFSLESQCFPGTLKLSGKQNYFPREKTLSVHVYNVYRSCRRNNFINQEIYIKSCKRSSERFSF